MKSKLSLSIIFLFSVFILSSCNSSNEITKREKKLFVQDYQSLALPINRLTDLNDLLNYFDSTYCIKHEEKWPYTYFDLKNKILTSRKNRNTIKIGIEPNPCDDMGGTYDATMILEIVKDGYNTEIEGFDTEIDSIPSFVRKQFLSFGEDPNYAIGGLGNGVWLCTKKADKLKNLNIYIYNIIEGYIKTIREYSHLAYGKSIDELNDKEFQELRNEFVFHLSFKYTDKNPSVMLDI